MKKLKSLEFRIKFGMEREPEQKNLSSLPTFPQVPRLCGSLFLSCHSLRLSRPGRLHVAASSSHPWVLSSSWNIAVPVPILYKGSSAWDPSDDGLKPKPSVAPTEQLPPSKRLSDAPHWESLRLGFAFSSSGLNSCRSCIVVGCLQSSFSPFSVRRIFLSFLRPSAGHIQAHVPPADCP